MQNTAVTMGVTASAGLGRDWRRQADWAIGDFGCMKADRLDVFPWHRQVRVLHEGQRLQRRISQDDELPGRLDMVFLAMGTVVPTRACSRSLLILARLLRLLLLREINQMIGRAAAASIVTTGLIIVKLIVEAEIGQLATEGALAQFATARGHWDAILTVSLAIVVVLLLGPI